MFPGSYVPLFVKLGNIGPFLKKGILTLTLTPNPNPFSEKGSYAPRYVLLQGNIGLFLGKTANIGGTSKKGSYVPRAGNIGHGELMTWGT